jgi:hypothetical protein
MDEDVVQQIIDEVFSSLEPLDAQGSALTEFLKAKGIATDEELAPFLKQAGNASSVRWLAAKVRIKSLISSAMKDDDKKPAEMKTVEGKSEKEAGSSKGESTDKPGQRASGSDAKASALDAKDDGAKKSADKRANENTVSENNKGGATAVEDTKGSDKTQAAIPAAAAEKNDDKKREAQPDRDLKEKVA